MPLRRLPSFVFSIALLVSPVWGQQQTSRDPLEQEILSHPLNDHELLGKSRAVLLESLQANDTAKAHKVLRYLDLKFDRQRRTILYPGEQILVDCWLSEFRDILEFARSVNPLKHVPERIAPDPDSFYDEMIDLSKKHEGLLRMNIRRSDLQPHERDFVLLALSDVLGRGQGDDLQREAFQKKMNDAADAYLTSYSNSEFNPFIREQIRYVTVKGLYGFGYGLTIGYLGLPGRLNRYLGDYGSLSFYGEGAYKLGYAYLGLDIGFNHGVRKEFEYNGTWPEGLSIVHTGMLLAVGPILEPGGGFLAIPTLGIGYMDFSPPEDEKKNTGKDVSMSFGAWAIGASFRIPLGGKGASSFITLNAGYRRAITGIDMARGGYTFLTLGWGMFTRPDVRDL